ncbi:MAG: DUF3299 domain-containing protein [Bryobacterales bacterium]|nr:DUF3299 domain-containing protein [Bryobacterales bacterium]
MVTTITRTVKFVLLGLCVLYVATALYIQHNGDRAIAAGFAEQVPPKQALMRTAAPRAAEPKARELWWKTMRGFDYRKGTVSEELRAFDGARVKIPGFMVPLEDDAEKVREFLLVPYMEPASTRRPATKPDRSRPHGSGQERRDGLVLPVWVEGIFRISKADSIYGDAAYTLAGHSTSKFQEESNR